MYEVQADRRGGRYYTSDLKKAESFAQMKGTVVQIHAPSLSAVPS